VAADTGTGVGVAVRVAVGMGIGVRVGHVVVMLALVGLGSVGLPAQAAANSNIPPVTRTKVHDAVTRLRKVARQ